MATHTKIIEFYGIPACGKSTLAKYIKDNLSSTYKVGLKYDMTREAREMHGLKFLLSVRLYDIFNAIRLHFSIPNDIKRSDLSLFNLIKFNIYYRFVSLFSSKDFYFIDHGIVQNCISYQNSKALFDLDIFVKSISHCLNCGINIIFVHCKIDPEDALIRMKTRGRNSGHIDVAKTDVKKFDMLAKEYMFCENYTDIIKRLNLSHITIDASTTVENEYKDLLNELRNKKII